MKIVDVNVLLYVVNRDTANHARARAWWEAALSDDDEALGLPWTVVLGFLRVATSARIFPNPLPLEVALETVDAWLSEHNVRIVRERDDHWHYLRRLVGHVGAAGNMATDAYLAALALTHDAVLVSFDNDFARFDGLRWENPGRIALTGAH